MNNNKIFNLPIFKNQNLSSTDVSESKELENLNLNTYNTEANANDSSSTSIREAASGATGEIFFKKEITTNSNRSALALSCINSMNNLVFFQKKGSIKANPNTIGYSFGKGKFSNKYLNITPLDSKSNTSTNLNKSFSFVGAPYNEINNLFIKFFKGMYCLISRPFFIFTSDVVKIQLFYFVAIPKYLNLKRKNRMAPHKNYLYWSDKSNKVKENLINLAHKNIINVYPSRFVVLANILSKIFNKTVELELIRLHQPYLDTNILVRFSALFINKRNISVWIKRLFNKNICASPAGKPSYKSLNVGDIGFAYNGSGKVNPAINQEDSAACTSAYLSGLKIKISGRLMKEPIIPRITTKKFEKGFTARGKVNYLEIAKLTHKNRKGAFTITIKSGQNFMNHK